MGATLLVDIGTGVEQLIRNADEQIRSASRALRRASMVVAWSGAIIKKYSGWGLLGFAGEHEYRQARGVSRSNWYKLVGIAEQLSHLTEEQFLAMTIENAEQLAAAPREQREDQDLVAQAALMTAEAFENALALNTAEREHLAVKDVPALLKLRMRRSQKIFIQNGVRDWCKEHGIEDEVFGLELLIAETQERATLVGFISESIPRLTRDVVSATTGEKALKQTVADYIREAGEMLRICVGEI